MSQLAWRPFHARYLTAMASFDCGDREAGAQEWQQEVNLWIRNQADEAVLYDMPKYDVDVWLYTNESNHFIGFGSIAPGLWDPVSGAEERIPINLLYMVGIDHYYQSQGGSNGINPKYSQQIIIDLFAKSIKRMRYSPLLGLYVHPQNEKARGWYENKLGFEYADGVSEYSEVYKVNYPAMYINMCAIPDAMRGPELPEAPRRAPFLAPSPNEG